MADNVESRVGFEATDALKTLGSLAKAVEVYTKTLKANPAAAKAFNSANSFEQALAAQNKILQETIKGLKQLSTQEQATAKASQAAATQTAAANRKRLAGAKAGLDGAKGAAKGLESQLASTLQAFVRYRIVSGVFIAIERQIRESITTAKELELRLAEIQTISPEFKISGIADVQNQVRAISESFGIDQIEVASGLYQTLSNQIGNAAQSTQFLNEAASFSRATLTSLSGSVDLLSGILNAYNLEASNAARISDVLFKTIELGRVRGEDLAANFGNITTQASQLGISVEEVGAALATITIQGVKADTAMTGLQNIFIKMVRPSQGLKDAMDQIGVSSIQAGISTFGLVGFLTRLEQTTNGTIEELGELFPRVRALRGEMALMAQEGQKAEDTFQEFKDAMAGVSAEAADLVLDTQAAQLEKNVETIRNAFTADVGTPLIEAINKTIEIMGGADQAAKLLTGTLRQLGPIAAAAVGVIAVQQMLSLTAAMAQGTLVARGLSIAIAGLGGPGLAALVIGIGALALVLNKQRDFAGELREELAALGQETQDRIREINEAQAEGINAAKREIQDNTDLIISDLRTRQQAFEANRDSAIRFQEQVTDSLKEQLKERLSLVNKLVTAVVRAQENARKEIDALSQGQIDFEFGINQGRFERNLKDIEDPAKRAQELIKRSSELLEAARRAEGVGNPEFAQRLIEDAANQAERAAGIAGQRASGESQVNAVLQARKDLNDRLIAQEEEKARLASEQENAIREQAVTLRRDIEQFNTQNAEITAGADSGRFNQAEIDARSLQVDALGARIRAQLEEVGSSGLDILLGQTEALRLLSDPFRDPLTGGQIELDFVAGDSVDRLVNTLKQTLDETPLEIQLAVTELTGVELGIQGFAQALSESAAFNTELKTGKDNTREFTAATEQLNLALTGIGSSSAKLVESFASIDPDRAGFFDGIGLEPDQIRIRQELLAGINAQIQGIDSTLQSVAATGDISGIDAIIGQLERFIEKGKETGGITSAIDLTQQADVAQQLLGILRTVGTAEAELEVQRQNAAETASGQSVLQRAADSVAEVGIASQATALVANEMSGTFVAVGGQIISIEQQKRQEIEATTQALREQEAAAAASGRANPGFSSGGQVMHFAEGGSSAARGTDTVPAMLSPGEFVVNAGSSRRFFSELVAINAGKPPVFKQEGGEVSNNFTGDINLNVSAPSGVVNGREAANQIRRELRRKTAKLS